MLSKQRIIDWRNMLLIAVVTIVVIGVGFVLPYLRSRGVSGPDGPLGKHDFTINYTESGFDPKEITVPVGSVIAWKNIGGRPMWVGSDPHPAHTDLEGFEQKQIINYLPSFIGEAQAHGQGIYEYKFTKVGTWGYHNHVNPAHTGKVIVIEKKSD